MDNDEISKFFHTTRTSIADNAHLRVPQRDAYSAVARHFSKHESPCYVQLPVGCGKTGLMGIMPFGQSAGRVLIIAPNLTIKNNIVGELDISDEGQCFYLLRHVLREPLEGPFVTELKASANIHDCDAAHVVVANAQQFARDDNRWFRKFPSDYFRMILVDEVHHSAAITWQNVFDYFNQAQVIGFTATPFRSDGQAIVGKRVYRYGYDEAMEAGYISQIEALHAAPAALTFTYKGKEETKTLEEVMELREQDWFSKGVALSDKCNEHIVEASIKQLSEVRKHGEPRMIIAVACSVRHAVSVATLYRARGKKAEVLHSNLKEEEKQKIEQQLRSGLIDVVVQVQMLGEGYDLGTLSVAAVFRPYRSLAPYVQFIGRILRLADTNAPHSPANKVYVVSHVGLNDERWWQDFKDFDKDDQAFFSRILGRGEADDLSDDPPSERKRMSLRPKMQVLDETIAAYIKSSFRRKPTKADAVEVLEALRSRGIDPDDLGLNEKEILNKLNTAANDKVKVKPHKSVVQPQKHREALRKQLPQEARSIANTVLNRLGLKGNGRKLLGAFKSHAGSSNMIIVVTLAQAAQNKVMGVDEDGRDGASVDQFKKGVAASADICDRLTKFIKLKLEKA